jgi:hypothetical protein
MAPLNVPATDPVLLWRTDAYWTGPQFTRSPAWGRAHEMGQIEARKAIGSRSVGGTASVPAIGEALVPAQQGCREGRVGGELAPLSFSPDAVPPFRPDLTVWAIRRRPENAIARWDGETYERVLAIHGKPVLTSVAQSGGVNAPQLEVSTSAAYLPTVTRNDHRRIGASARFARRSIILLPACR